MEEVSFLAKFWGLLMSIVCALYLVNKKGYERFRPLVDDHGFIVLSGFLSLVMGLISLLFYNAWSLEWPVVITIFGWLALIKGCVRIFDPNLVARTFKGISPGVYRGMLAVFLLLSLALTYYGYTAA